MPRVFLAALVALALGLEARAQTPPSEARIKADVLQHAFPGATDVVPYGDGRRELNRGVYQYARGVTVRTDHSEMDGVWIELYGDAVYDSHGSTYTYTDYRPGDSRWFGLPDPTSDEVLALIDQNPSEAFPPDALDLPRSAELIEGEETWWHSPNSVTVPVRLTYTAYAQGPDPDADLIDGRNLAPHESMEPDPGTLADFVVEAKIRMSREDLDAPWSSDFSMTRTSQDTETGRRPGDLGIPTLDDRALSSAAAAYASTLPQVEAPAFASGTDLADWLYTQFRSTRDRDALEASIRAVLPSSAYTPGQEGALTLDKQMWLTQLLENLLRGDASFAELTCPEPSGESETYGNGQRVRYVWILAAREGQADVPVMDVMVEQEAGGYRNGQPVPGRWVATDVRTRLRLNVRTQDDDLAWIRSFDDPAAICSSAGRATQSAAQEATDGAQGAVEGAVQEGRRRIGRIFGRGGN